MVKSPLRYPGGKSKAIKFLKQFVPEFKEFREPMVGGGSLSFYVAQEYPDRKISVSDLNYELYCFWKCLQKETDELVGHIQNIFDTRTDGRELFDELVSKRDSKLSDMERATHFFVLNRITFSGTVDAGGYSEQSFQKRFTQSSIDRLKKAAETIQEFSIFNSDYNDLLTRKGEDVFIFLDPPYYSATNSRLYGKNGVLHTQFDHQLFFSHVSSCEHRWLITYDNSEYIRNLYKDFYQVEWELQYGMNNYKQSSAARGKELLVANYDICKIKEQ